MKGDMPGRVRLDVDQRTKVPIILDRRHFRLHWQLCRAAVRIRWWWGWVDRHCGRPCAVPQQGGWWLVSIQDSRSGNTLLPRLRNVVLVGGNPARGLQTVQCIDNGVAWTRRYITQHI